jgi:ornithine cyclodeaminase
MLIVDMDAVQTLIEKVTLSRFYQLLIQYIEEDFRGWMDFEKRPRISQHHQNGILELMPILNSQFYANKYVCTYPNNRDTYTVIGQGLWVDAQTGMPLMAAEMTLLTALRTAAVSALASRYLANRHSQKLAIIGCGAQSEFQVMSHFHLFPLEEVTCFDVNPTAMKRLVHNLRTIPCRPTFSIQEAVENADIIITVTNANRTYPVLSLLDVKLGVHINAMGGDSPGSSELDIELLKAAQRIVVEYLPQTIEEGEVQQLTDLERGHVCELWEIITGSKSTRLSERDITIFDGVGFAILDFSTLRLIWDLHREYQFGIEHFMVPAYQPDEGLFQQLFKHEK